VESQIQCTKARTRGRWTENGPGTKKAQGPWTCGDVDLKNGLTSNLQPLTSNL
jgi:hypothetical protein